LCAASPRCVFGLNNPLHPPALCAKVTAVL
jgi:hypothetical protein